MAQSAALDFATGSGSSVQVHLLLAQLYCACLVLATLIKKTIVPNRGDAL